MQGPGTFAAGVIKSVLFGSFSVPGTCCIAGKPSIVTTMLVHPPIESGLQDGREGKKENCFRE